MDSRLICVCHTMNLMMAHLCIGDVEVQLQLLLYIGYATMNIADYEKSHSAWRQIAY